VCAAAISGVTLEGASGRPLARSRVELVSVQHGYDLPLTTALTDSNGRFRFANLAAGTYFLIARRGGFAPERYGQRSWNTAGTPIVLGADAEFSAEFRMRRLGAISGQVLDENRVGLEGNTVSAYATDHFPPRLAGSAVSDDRGMYRIAGLEPGVYYVRSGPQELEGQRSLLPTYYGQTSSEQGPQQVEVELDRETRGVDVQPLAGRLGQLRGRVTGGVLSRLWLISASGVEQAVPGGAGEFRFDRLAPGEYELLGISGERSLAAWRKIRIEEGANETTLEAGAMPVAVTRVEEKEGGEADPRRVTVTLKRGGISAALPLELPLSGVGSAVIPVMPGEYAASAEAAREYYVDSVRASGATGAENEFRALPGQRVSVEVTVGTRPAVLRGVVKTPDGQPAVGAPVFLNAMDAGARQRMGGTRMARAGQDGRYEFPGLAPGDYEVVSTFEFRGPKEANWQGVPARMVTLTEGQEASLDLELAGPK
jgi:protocatechuate 3,4-dioxygenase beta subunit